ncbi:MAG: TetR/AcrR family transcriptional regulator [Acidimicrobiia bacterium]
MPRIRAETIEAHKALTRSDIVDAAHEILAEMGSADISLAEVAHAAGIGRTTLYEYFRDKDDLIASLVEERLPVVVDEMIESVSAVDAVEERILALASATVRFVISDPVLGVILHRELPRLSADAQARIRVAHADLAREMTATWVRGVKERRFREMAPDAAGRFMNELIMAAAKILIASPNAEQRFPEVIGDLEHFLLGGLRG